MQTQANVAILNIEATDATHASIIQGNLEKLGKSARIMFMQGGKLVQVIWDAVTKSARVIWDCVELVWDKVCDFLSWLKRVITGAVNGAKAQA